MNIIELSKQIPDPRVAGRTVHKMENIIYITVAAVLAGCQTWNEIAEFGKTKIEFFRSRLPGLETTPSHDTFNRFFSIFDPKGFEEVFRNWVRQIIGDVKGVIAIDGKLMRGSSKCDAEHTLGQDDFRMWIVSAWSSENSISLGQEKVGDKTNEITVVPKLLSAIDLENTIVTIDAMGCQTTITQKIREGGGTVLSFKRLWLYPNFYY